jgi:hypothetical protein
MTKPPDNLTLLKTQTDELRAYVEHLKRELTAMADMAQDIAKARRALYDAYVAEGFTEAQALIMCQKLTY